MKKVNIVVRQPRNLFPFYSSYETPIQSEGATSVIGSVELFEEICDGVRDVERFSRMILVYHFHLAKSAHMEVTPSLDEDSYGVFATGNPIGSIKPAYKLGG